MRHHKAPRPQDVPQRLAELRVVVHDGDGALLAQGGEETEQEVDVQGLGEGGYRPFCQSLLDQFIGRVGGHQHHRQIGPPGLDGAIEFHASERRYNQKLWIDTTMKAAYPWGE